MSDERRKEYADELRFLAGKLDVLSDIENLKEIGFRLYGISVSLYQFDSGKMWRGRPVVDLSGGSALPGDDENERCPKCGRLNAEIPLEADGS